MAAVIDKISWGASRDDDGHREYKIKWLVKADVGDGPVRIFTASGLAAIGSYWNFGGYDQWAFCTPKTIIAPHQHREGEPHEYWTAEQTFSTKLKSKRCQSNEVGDPLLELPKVSGTFVSNRREAINDRYGRYLVTSAREKLVGPGVEFDFDNPTVHIEMNLATLPLVSFSSMINTVNDSPLWGLPARFVKLSSITWERKICEVCTFYYTVGYNFQIDYSTLAYEYDSNGNPTLPGYPIGFDRQVFDYGNRCLRGYWTKINNEFAFVVTATSSETASETIMGLGEEEFDIYRTPTGEVSQVPLDGKGRPAFANLYRKLGDNEYNFIEQAGPPASAILEYYRQSNFLSLGIPISL